MKTVVERWYEDRVVCDGIGGCNAADTEWQARHECHDRYDSIGCTPVKESTGIAATEQHQATRTGDGLNDASDCEDPKHGDGCQPLCSKQ